MSVLKLQATLVNLMAADVSGADLALAVDGTVYPGETPVRETGLRSGSWVSLLGSGHTPQGVVRPLPGLLQVRTVSGAGAGRTVHAGRGSVAVTDDPQPTTLVAHEDRTVEVAYAGEPEDGGAEQAPPVVVPTPRAVPTPRGAPGAPRVPTVDGEPVRGRRALAPGDQVVLGDRIVEVRDHADDAAAVEFAPDAGAVRYNRPPRFLPPEPPAQFRLPQAPTEPPRQGLPWLMALVPLVFSGVMALALNNPRMLAFGLMSPIMMIGNVVNGRKQGRARHKQQVAEHADLTARIERDAAEAVVAERARRLFLYPDAAEVATIATTPTPRLWERRTGDEHHLALRCGTATQPSAVRLEDPEQLEHHRTVVRDVRDVPAVVHLPTVGVLGVAGAEGSAARLARWLVAQVGVLHSPRDVQVYVLSAPEGRGAPAPTSLGAATASTWDFLTWLPHARPLFGQDCLRTVGFGAQSLARRIAELQQLVDARREAAQQQVRTRQPDVVVVLDGAHRLRAMPGVTRILAEGPALGMYAICLDEDDRLLPEECDTVVQAVGPTELVIRRHREDPVPAVLPDWVDEDWLDWVCRALAPVEDASPQVSDAAIPDSSRLLDVLGLEPPTPDAIAARWLLDPRSTVATVGESIDGAFRIDLAADGPHALVAGTTGSGKSELLQTLVASLAVANSPEGMTFVLVDYKGGAAFKDCVHLPHTVGMVTDLDPHLVERALESLGAELRYREHALAEAGAKDLEDYLDLTARRPELPALPRLAIVIDEFASLARELPDFVTGLVSIAQRGRSLGIHLVLATQRPSGVVSSEIRANTNLRIALRVTDAAESSDVIDAPDAARIGKSTPGRAYVRLGSTSLIPFQSGRVGGRRPSASGTEAAEAPLVQRVVLPELADPVPQRSRGDAGDKGDVERTDLSELVRAVRAAAAQLRVPAPRRPWLPPLPEQLRLADLGLPPAGAPAVDDLGAPVPFGLADLAAEQRQPPVLLDLEGETGHLSIVGAARTGRTTALRTIAAAVARVYPVDQAHVYAIDCGNGGLLALRDLPHVGAVTTRSQLDETVRLVGRLRVELKRRQELLATAGYADAGEQRRAVPREHRLPRLVLLLDSWEGYVAAFEQLDNGALVDAVTVLLREGASAGIHVVLTGDRQLVTGRIGSLVEDKIALRLIERSDYTMFGLNPRTVPEDVAPGRGFRAGSGTEVQIAVAGEDPSGPGQREHLAALAVALRERDRDVPRERRPFGVQTMPALLPYAELVRRAAAVPGDARLLLGVGGEDVEPLGPDPLTGPAGFVIGGPGQSGRSVALLALARSALDRGHDVVVVAPRTSPVRTLAGAVGPAGNRVRAVLTDAEITRETLEPLLATVPGGPAVVVAVDDADLLRDIEADAWLRTVIPRAAEQRLLFVIAGHAEVLAKGFSGWIVEVRKYRQGLLLKPQTLVDGDLIGGRLRRSDLGGELPPGRGFVQVGTAPTVAVQVALAATTPEETA